MKKIMMFSLVVVFGVAMASSVFAAAVTLTGAIPGGNAAVTTTIAGASFIPSTNVNVIVCASNTQYTASSVHNSALGAAGGRAFGATNATGIQWLSVSASGSAVSTVTCATAGTMNPASGWTSL